MREQEDGKGSLAPPVVMLFRGEAGSDSEAVFTGLLV